VKAKERFKRMIKEIVEVLKKYEDLEQTEYAFAYEYLKNTAEATLRALEKDLEKEKRTKP